MKGLLLAMNQHCTPGILSTVRSFVSRESKCFLGTDDGESPSWPLGAWPPCSVSRKKHQGQQLFSKERLLGSELMRASGQP